ncbi:MAG: hypothetical protein NWP87_05995 [Winogradskyella sp.]|nr:hypothetical protein [Winogradskyella sp.]
MNLSDYLKKKNVKRFSLFFAMAFLFLIFFKLSNDYKQIVKLKLNLVNLQDEVIIQDDSLNVIDAYAEAKGFAFLPFIFNKTKVISVDVNSDVISKPNHFIFNVQKHQFLIETQLGKSYKVLSLSPDSLKINYSKRATKLVPIILKSTIDYAAGYDIKDDFKLNIDSVKLVGSAIELDKINAVNTENLVLKDVNTNVNESVGLDVSGYGPIEIFPKSVNVKGEIRRFTEGTIEIPISVENKPNDININFFPKSVTLSYYVDLDNYKGIAISDFKVECNYAELEENQTYLIPKIVKKPEFVKRISIKQKRIDFIKL